MKFTPKTEEELNEIKLVPEGKYSFEVLNAEPMISKGGNEMIKLTLGIWDKEGQIHTIFDYLLEAMAYKLKHFCDAIGLSDKYKEGSIEPFDLIAKLGTLNLIIQKGKDNPNGGKYPDKNSVRDYIIDSVSIKEDTLNDDLPF
jgi:hypothetical protein